MNSSDKITRISYVIEAAFEYFISMFVTGTMLGYILDTLGFSDAVQGIICTVATFTCGAQLFALTRSGKKVKKFATVGHLINQSCFCLIYLLPLFKLPSELKTVLLVALLFAGHIINNAVNPSMITWYMSAVPDDRRGRFTAIKEMISLAGGIAVSFLLGRVADIYRDTNGLPTRTYYVICAVALFVMMLIHTATHIAAEEKPQPDVAKTSFGETLGRIAKNKSFIKIIAVGLLWNVASAISVSFFTSYLREELDFSFTVISIFTIVSSLSRIILSPLLGKIADKYSFAASMTISFALAALGFIAVVFTSPETRWLYVAYSCLYGFAMAGINSGVINFVYDYVPPIDRAAAMGTNSALGGIIAFLTALLSGAILSFVQKEGGVRLLGFTLYAQQLLALISFIITILLVVYMRTVIAPMRRVSDED